MRMDTVDAKPRLPRYRRNKTLHVPCLERKSQCHDLVAHTNNDYDNTDDDRHRGRVNGLTRPSPSGDRITRFRRIH